MTGLLSQQPLRSGRQRTEQPDTATYSATSGETTYGTPTTPDRRSSGGKNTFTSNATYNANTGEQHNWTTNNSSTQPSWATSGSHEDQYTNYKNQLRAAQRGGASQAELNNMMNQYNEWNRNNWGTTRTNTQATQTPDPNQGLLGGLTDLETPTPNQGLLAQSEAQTVTQDGRTTNVLNQTVNPILQMGYINSGWKNGMSNGMELDSNQTGDIVRDLMRIVVEGEDRILGTEGNRDWAQQQTFNRLNNIMRENPDWRQRIEEYMQRLALGQMGGVFKPESTLATKGQYLRNYDDRGLWVKDGNGLHQWYKNNTPDWQNQVNSFVDAYKNQQVERTPNMTSPVFNWGYGEERKV